jgi:hypothetical protein
VHVPSPQDILAGLTRIANAAVPVAILWHVAVGLAALAVALGARPSRRLAALLACAPLVSVSVVAFAFDNAWNGIVFALLSSLLVAIAARLDPGRVACGPIWARLAGGALLAFGWAYPHFLQGLPFVASLYAAPLGLLPCPTLAVVIAATLLGGGLGSRAFAFILAGAGLFYGVYGIWRLGVVLDIGLLLGAVALAALVARPTPRVHAAIVGAVTRGPACAPANCASPAAPVRQMHPAEPTLLMTGDKR